MTNYPNNVVVLIKADRLEQANNFLERRGYGPNNFGQHALILKTDPDDAAPRGYGTEIPADAALLATLQKVAASHPQARIFVGDRSKKHAKEFIDAQGYRLKPKTDP